MLGFQHTFAQEFRSVLLLLEQSGRVEQRELVEKLFSDPGFDWTALEHLLLRHRILGLFQYQLKEVGMWGKHS